MLKKSALCLFLSAAILLPMIRAAHAAGSVEPSNAPVPYVGITTFSILYAPNSQPDAVDGYGTTNRQLETFQFEHFGFASWGDIYFDAELYNGKNVGTPFSPAHFQDLLVFNPELSIGKITGMNMNLGPISDVVLTARFERSSYLQFQSQNYGASLDFKIPGLAFAESGLLFRKTNFDQASYLWRTVLLSNPIDIAGQNFHFNLLSLINGSKGNGTQVFERGEILWEMFGHPQFQLGTRVELSTYANNPLSITGGQYSRFTPEIMFKYTF